MNSGLIATLLLVSFTTGYGIRLSYREWRYRHFGK